MTRAAALFASIALATALMCGVADAREETKVTILVRLVVAGKEGKEKPAPKELADIAPVLRKLGYKTMDLVPKPKRYKLAQDDAVTHQITKTHRLGLEIRSIDKTQVKLTMALQQWDEDKERYKTMKKVLVRLRRGRSAAMSDNRVRIADKDTFAFVTYVVK